MELELGLKFTRNLDDNNVHTTDFRIAKDRGGPMFITRETETMFVLAAHLRGYGRNNIEIDINEDATLITISGEKAVQELVMKGLMMHKKEMEIERFNKVFRIPKDVILDGIQAKFNEHDLTLRIYMAKLHEGIIGGVIEEIKCKRLEENSQENQEANNVVSQARRKDDQVVEEAMPGSEKWEIDDDQEASCSRSSNINDDGKTGEIIHKVKQEANHNDDNHQITKEQAKQDWDDQKQDDDKESSCLCFTPCFLIGGALISSFVLLCNFVRLKRR